MCSIIQKLLSPVENDGNLAVFHWKKNKSFFTALMIVLKTYVLNNTAVDLQSEAAGSKELMFSLYLFLVGFLQRSSSLVPCTQHQLIAGMAAECILCFIWNESYLCKVWLLHNMNCCAC